MNLKYYAVCECCNLKVVTRNKWELHLKSQKHARNGKSKAENYVCETCGYWCLHIYNLNIHKIVRHGTIEQKKKAPFYCEHCNRSFFRNLYYDRHLNSDAHKKIIKKILLIENNQFKNIDKTLVEQNYMLYLNELETKIESSLLKLYINLSNQTSNRKKINLLDLSQLRNIQTFTDNK